MSLDDIIADGAPPIVAILRGLSPDRAVAVGEALVVAGIRLIEVPLNSPDPLTSIKRMCDSLGKRALCGAGTVLTPDAASKVAQAGGRLVVMPNTDKAVIARAVELGLEALPGVATPTEAFKAIAAGARRLKLFPAAHLGPVYLKALSEVLPADVRLWAVGGTDPGTMPAWLDAGAEGIGVGGALFRPSMRVEEVSRNASDLVAAWTSYRARKSKSDKDSQ